MDKETVIETIRKESLDLPTDQFTVILSRFRLESYSNRCLNEMPLDRLEDMLGTIRRLVILGDTTAAEFGDEWED